AEESIPFGLEGAVVDRFRLLHLTMRPRSDLVGRGERDANGVEDERIFRFFEETEEVFHHWAISPAGPSALLTVLGELDVECKALQLLHHDVEGLGQARLEDVLALDDRLVHASAARDVIRLDRQDRKSTRLNFSH